jgi:beta-lactamase superfamily II metal-dependent hydrolase
MNSSHKYITPLILSLITVGWLAGCSSPPPAGEPEPLRIHFIDAGQGDCIFLEFPDGKNLLIDAGPDTAAVVLSRFLDSLSVTVIDNALLTHPHADHYGGFRKMVQTRTVGRWLENNILSYDQQAPEYAALQAALDSAGIRRDTLQRGDTVAGYTETAIRVLWPLAAPRIGREDNVNGNSIVLHITYGVATLFLSGDLNEDAEKVMLDSGWLAPVDLLKVGHHGSKTSSTFPFLQALMPRISVVPVHLPNSYNLPADDTMLRFVQLGLVFYRMDETGSLCFLTAGQAINIGK